MRVAVCMYATYMNCYAMLFGTGLRASVPRQENGIRESGRDEPIVTLAVGSILTPATSRHSTVTATRPRKLPCLRTTRSSLAATTQCVVQIRSLRSTPLQRCIYCKQSLDHHIRPPCRCCLQTSFDLYATPKSWTRKGGFFPQVSTKARWLHPL